MGNPIWTSPMGPNLPSRLVGVVTNLRRRRRRRQRPSFVGARTTNRVPRVHLERTACPCMQGIIKYILDMVRDLDPAVQLIHVSTPLPLASTSTIIVRASDRTRLRYIRPPPDVLLQALGNFERKLGRTFDPQPRKIAPESIGLRYQRPGQ